jgi:hypothetical protein
MPKGQQRSNREHKKPKQPKPLPAAPGSSTGRDAGGAGSVKKK